MSLQDVLVLVVAGPAVVVTAVWAARDQRAWAGRRTAQLVAGSVCGIAAALAVASPFVDVVPDAEEGVVAAGGVVLVAVLAVAVPVVAGGRVRRARDQVPRS